MNDPAASLLSAATAAVAAGQRQQAIDACRAALQQVPDHLDGHFLLGTLLAEAGAYDEAIIHLRKAGEIAPWSARVWNNLATVYRLLQQRDAAVDCYLRALAAEPDMREAGGNLQAMLDRLDDAALGALGAARVADAYAAVGQFQRLLGNAEAALAAYRKAERWKPRRSDVAFQIAALTGNPAPRPAAGDVAAMFDGYAEVYERHLVEGLEYRVPQRMAELLAELDGHDRRYASAVDLGCGTGLSGMVVRARCDRLIGVDLSEKMLDKARARGVYDELHAADVFAFLESDTRRHDLCVTAEVVVYIGDLAPLFRLLAERLTASAPFLLSIERGAAGADYAVGAGGRYAHSPDYVLRCAEVAGFMLAEQREIPLRKDGDGYCAGVLFAFRR